MSGVLMIGLTGGPCAGKTKVLEILKEKNDGSLLFVPEIATFLGNIGFDMKDPRFEKIVYDCQGCIEQIVRGEANPEKIKAIIFDRTQLDTLVYSNNWEDLTQKVKEFNLVSSLYNFYHAIIYLESMNLEDFFANNPLRKEKSLEEVIESGHKTYSIMKDHPQFYYIPAMKTIEEKANKVDELIRTIIEKDSDCILR